MNLLLDCLWVVGLLCFSMILRQSLKLGQRSTQVRGSNEPKYVGYRNPQFRNPCVYSTGSAQPIDILLDCLWVVFRSGFRMIIRQSLELWQRST